MSNFTFGFSGDDIEIDENEETSAPSDAQAITNEGQFIIDPLPSACHSLKELVSQLPSHLSYSLRPFTLQTSKHVLRIPCRELFEIRAQLMIEDPSPGSSHGPTEALLSGLDNDDIKTNVYEGGFKTWECASDLAAAAEEWFCKNAGDNLGPRHIIELGVGTAIPTLVLFAFLLQSWQKQSYYFPPIHFTLCDYNHTVLRLATLPNLFLTWLLLKDKKRGGNGGDECIDPQGDIEVTPATQESFIRELEERNITIFFVSGAWGDQFTKFIAERAGSIENFADKSNIGLVTLVMASETIYSPLTIGIFSKTLMGILRLASKSNNRSELKGVIAEALVAAKRIYFGVGGGVDEYVKLVENDGGVVNEVSGVAEEGGGIYMSIISAGDAIYE
ncbi:MAG: hypothetical protein M1834_005147 [Cirrosporium novae-zelandiae]|nr:MAG: hypothetical protein M1834_005147 [Cirrosporium novae-zelandiae]